MIRRAITLTELVIAVVLMSVVIMGAVSFNIATQKVMGNSERRVAIANELSLVLDYIHKDISSTSGTAPETLPKGATPANAPAFYLRTDMVGGMIPGTPPLMVDGAAKRLYLRDDASTPSDTSDDTFRRYSFCASNNTICQFNGGNFTVAIYEGGAYEVLTYHAVAADYEISNGCFKINTMTLRYDPESAADASTNPEVTIKDVSFCSGGCALD